MKVTISVEVLRYINCKSEMKVLQFKKVLQYEIKSANSLMHN